MQCFFFAPMACSERGGTKILLCLGLLLVASCHCTRLTKLKALDKLRGNSTLSHGRATGSELCHGRLLIGQNSLQGAKLKGTKATKNLLDSDTDYQADMGAGHPRQPEGHKDDNAAVKRLLQMEPKVECTGDAMKLQVQDAASTPGSLFFVDRGSRLSPLPLSKLPPSCGYTIRSTRRDLLLVAPYDGCFVALEEDSYVLPLRWLGLPVRMSCPLMRQSSPNPPMVTCHAEGMVVKLEWTVSVAEIKVHLTGNWEPLMKASPRCGFSVVVHPEGVVISIRYAPCLEKKDGMYTMELAGDGETKISCPSLSPAQPEPTKNPTRDPKPTSSKATHPSIPPHKPASTRAPEPTPKNPAQSAVPQVPGFPQNPEVSNERPNQGSKDFYQPQLPYFPFYPNFYYPYPENPDTEPTPAVQPTPRPIKKNVHSQTAPPAKLPLIPEVPQPFVPLPFYPWPAQPEKEVPLQPPAPQQLDSKEKQPFYPYPFYVKPPNPDSVPPASRPEPKPLPSISPIVRTTKDQRWKPSYPFPIYPQPPKPETLPTEPPVTQPSPGKVEEPFPTNPLNHPSQPQQEIVNPSASQPEGEKQKPPHLPFYLWPPQPPASEAPQVEPHPLYPEDPEKLLPEQPVLPKPPVSEEPQGQMYYPFYPYPFLPQSPYVPVPPVHQTPTPAPKGPVQPLSTLQPEGSKPEAPEKSSPSKPAPENKEPPQPEAPQGQVYNPFYPNPFYPNPFNPQPEPENQPATKPPQPPEPELPQGQMYQPSYPFYPQPEPENPPGKKTTAVPKPPVTETPKEHVDKPSYPQSFKPSGAGTNGKAPTEKPAQREQPSAVKPPDGQVPHHFNPYYYYYMEWPQHPEPVTVAPTTTMQQSQQVTTPASGHTSPETAISQPSYAGIVPQAPELSSSYMPPVYCPQFCPSGFSNCCPQIAFHQHHHHIVPAGPGSKDAPPVYPGLPFLPSVASSGFANGFGSTPLPQKPAEAATTSTSAPISPQSFPSGNEKQPYLQPPGGNPAELPESNPSKPTNSDPVYPYFVPNSLYPYWPYPQQNVDLQNLAQRQSPTPYSVPSKTQAPVNEPVNPVVQYVPYYIQPPKQQVDLSTGDMISPSGPNFMSFISQNLQQQHIAKQQNVPTAKELQPSNTKSIEFQTPEVHSELNRPLVPYNMLQDAQAPTYTKPALPNNYAQPIESGSKKSARHDQTVTAYSEPKSYVLLRHGPPGREVNSFSESALPSRHLSHDANLPQNLARHHGSKHQHPQNLRPLQEKTQHPKGLGKGMSNPSPGNVNYMPRPGDKSESLSLPFSASDGPHFAPLPQDPSFSAAHLKPKFFDSFKHLWMPQGSSQRIPAHVPGKAFQQWRSAADYQD